jgi:hypothetical protein
MRYTVRHGHARHECADILDALRLMRGFGAGAIIVRDDGVTLASVPGYVPPPPRETGWTDLSVPVAGTVGTR